MERKGSGGGGCSSGSPSRAAGGAVVPSAAAASPCQRHLGQSDRKRLGGAGRRRFYLETRRLIAPPQPSAVSAKVGNFCKLGSYSSRARKETDADRRRRAARRRQRPAALSPAPNATAPPPPPPATQKRSAARRTHLLLSTAIESFAPFRAPKAKPAIIHSPRNCQTAPTGCRAASSLLFSLLSLSLSRSGSLLLSAGANISRRRGGSEEEAQQHEPPPAPFRQQQALRRRAPL